MNFVLFVVQMIFFLLIFIPAPSTSKIALWIIKKVFSIHEVFFYTLKAAISTLRMAFRPLKDLLPPHN
jgi:hypothetical protein